jgi:hypothetical protein
MNSSGDPFDAIAARNTGTYGRMYPNNNYPGQSSQRASCVGVQFGPDGNSLFSTHYFPNSSGVMCEWSLTSPYYIGIDGIQDDPASSPPIGQPTLVYERAMNETSPVSSSRTYDFRISPNGKDMLASIYDAQGSLAKYSMTTAWDLSTMSYVSKYSIIPFSGSGQHGPIFIPPDGNCVYGRPPFTNNLRQYLLATPWNPTIIGGTFSQDRDMAPEIGPALPSEAKYISAIYLTDGEMTLAPGYSVEICGELIDQCLFQYRK